MCGAPPGRLAMSLEGLLTYTSMMTWEWMCAHAPRCLVSGPPLAPDALMCVCAPAWAHAPFWAAADLPAGKPRLAAASMSCPTLYHLSG